MPLLPAGVLLRIVCYFVKRVEVEVLCQVVHTLHLLLAVHLEPLFDVDSEVFALLFKTHFGPLGRIEAIRARRVVAVTFSLSGNRYLVLSLTPPSLRSGFSVRVALERTVVTITSNLIVVLSTIAFTSIEGLLSSPLPDFVLRELVVALQGLGWRLNYTRE